MYVCVRERERGVGVFTRFNLRKKKGELCIYIPSPMISHLGSPQVTRLPVVTAGESIKTPHQANEVSFSGRDKGGCPKPVAAASGTEQ